MKIQTATVLAWLLGNAATCIAQLSLENMGEPFNGKSVEVIWKAPTNKLSATLNVFRVLPTVFLENVISNVILLGEFKEPAKVQAVFQPALRGQDISFQEPDSGKYLSISPVKGFVNYFNHKATALPRTPIEGVPTEQEAFDLAMRVLPKLGIKESDLAHKPDGKELEFLKVVERIGSFDKQEGKIVAKPVLQGVIFFRQIDGIGFSGSGDCGGVRVEFGNNAKIKELALAWRNLKLDRTVTVANSKQIIQWIHEGKAVIDFLGMPSASSSIKILTINQITPYYFARSSTEIQKTIYPYAMISARADLGFTNALVRLSCPIFK